MSLGVETWAAPTGRDLTFLGLAGLLVTFGHGGLKSLIIAHPTALSSCCHVAGEHDDGNATPGDQQNPSEGESVRQLAPDD
jgi:hypothetical protein